jgi:REP element-mobilizing transposase RayT
MPRKPRVFIEGGIYHVYCRTSRGEAVFDDQVEAQAFVDVFRKVKERDGLVVFAWCLMSNHYHIALRTTEAPLWRSMASIQGTVSKGHNRRHRVFGPLWQGRYKAHFVENENYLYQLVAYIHLNPVSAGLVDDPSEYSWSGHSEILDKKKQGLVDSDETLLMFGANRRTAQRSYMRALNAAGEEEWVGERLERLPWWRPPEDDELAPREGTVYVDYLGRSTAPERPNLDADTFLERACEILDSDIEEIVGRGKGTSLRQLREMISLVGVERHGQSVRAMAERLRKNPGSVSRWVSDSAERRARDPEFAARLDEFDKALREMG